MQEIAYLSPNWLDKINSTEFLSIEWFKCLSYRDIDDLMDCNLSSHLAKQCDEQPYSDKLHAELEEVEAEWVDMSYIERERLVNQILPEIYAMCDNKKYTYVKIEGHKNWFLMVSDVNGLPPTMCGDGQRALLDVVTKEFDTAETPYQQHNALLKMEMLSRGVVVDYPGFIEKYGTILIREIGSWMTLHETLNIIDTTQSVDFPK